MCLAIPGKIVTLQENTGIRIGKIDYGGITRDACLEYVPNAVLGDYVLVHVGFAVSKVDEEEAARTYKYLAEIGQLSELETPEPKAPNMNQEEHSAPEAPSESRIT